MEEKSLKEQIEEYLKTLSFKIEENIYTRDFEFQPQATTFVNGQAIQQPVQTYTCKIEDMGEGNIEGNPIYYYTFQLYRSEYEKEVDFEQGIYNLDDFKKILKQNIGI